MRIKFFSNVIHIAEEHRKKRSIVGKSARKSEKALKTFFMYVR